MLFLYVSAFLGLSRFIYAFDTPLIRGWVGDGSYMVIKLYGYKVIWLLGYWVIKLYGYMVIGVGCYLVCVFLI